ncbi:amino acid adenylation domain-containing protein [Rhizobium sp. L1K21]|uniref:amino acid adenylation domain-containing protein n=1 Tax=Rhizobium sp. L1K21 TaxID=2954933 RepID=UPI00209214E7|nr:amino acid adenylation domain-containing protein [Rhizobium sp. L1K21]MCO6187569.1 amino acid adenylation domain-containing protein [Rhizobium sp. L1K21]
MRDLTQMQAAYWVGRNAEAPLGGVSAHLYAEFDGAEIDPERLSGALAKLCRKHAMTRLRITPEGEQEALSPDASPSLKVEDFRGFDSKKLDDYLLRKRKDWTNQKLDIAHGESLAVGLSLLPNGTSRLHVDTDMIAIDPVSFTTLMEDLARFYTEPDADHEAQPGTGFFDWLDSLKADQDIAARLDQDRQWWKVRLGEIAPAPSLPQALKSSDFEVNSGRLSRWLPPEIRNELAQVSGRHGITLSTLMLSLFSLALGGATGDRRFRLNVPMFWREPVVENVQHIVGEFSNTLILNAAIEDHETLAAFCRKTAQELAQLLSHSAYPGVSVMRDLSRHTGTMQTAPVVFTAGLDLPSGELFSPQVREAFGSMEWAVSQGPYVVLDAQVAALDGGILVNWDIRFDQLPQAWISSVFDTYIDLVQRVARQPDIFEIPAVQCADMQRDGDAPTTNCEIQMTRPLSALQKAYLMGRSEHLPLGGVAMQDFREYRGRIDIELLHTRLENLVARYESLRKIIDADRLVERLDEEGRVNFEEVSLQNLSYEEALQRVDAMRDDYAHCLFDLQKSPWQVTAFRLPPPDNRDDDTVIVFLRFDALILDGRSISLLVSELFGQDELTAHEAGAEKDEEPAVSPDARLADGAYWAEKLGMVEEPPRLPWKRPLTAIATSRYQRSSLRIDKNVFKAFSRAGARQGLFKNTCITAIILEVLSRWLSDGDLCVGVPVAPLGAASVANRSSFLAVNWQPEKWTFEERAKGLQADILEGLNHLSFSGIDINRLLMNNGVSSPSLPVVITNGLSWPNGDEQATGMRYTDGLTQTPQIAMDFRFSLSSTGDLVFDIDFAREAVEEYVVNDILAAIGRAVEATAASGAFEVRPSVVVERKPELFNAARNKPVYCNFLQRISENLFEKSTEKTALICGPQHISYQALGENVGRIVAALEDHGIGKGSVVAICLRRSPEHVMVSVACALMGVVWVPIDASSPADRLQYLLENCKPALVVSHQQIAGFQSITPAELLNVERKTGPAPQLQGLEALSTSGEVGYYLYTSGTTGKPKCVVLSNRATANVIGQTIGNWRVSERDVFLSVTPFHHDMSVFDIFGSLTAGATLVLPQPEEEKDAIRWNALVREHGVTIWCSVPAILEMLLSCRQTGDLKSLRLVAQGGDYIKPSVIETLRNLNQDMRLVSLGGPTETTIWSIWHEIGALDIETIPYGRPLAGNSYFILNARGEHCPAHVEGRIHTAGVNVALGYLEDGILNQKDFVTVEDEDGKPVRAFRTGDRARYRPDGTIIFAGRVNGYVKVRGVRVSLPDIEAEIAKHPGIHQALAVDYGEEKQGEAAIGILYVAREGARLDAQAIRNFARQQLPNSHVPTRFSEVDTMPLSANGKPDRRQARALLTASAAAHEPTPTKPENADATTSRRVLDIYLAALGRQDLADANAATDFVTIGLLPSHLKTISRNIGEEFGVDLPPRHLLNCRNADQVARLLP